MAPSAADFVVSDDEDKEFRRSLQSSLLVQAPLQVILEGLFDKLKAQSSVIHTLTSEVEKLRGDGEVDPVDRIRLLERRMNEMFGEPGSEPRLSPFKQQELLDRVDHLEATVAAQADAIHELRESGNDEVTPRIEALEAALHGVDNLAGRQVALDAMADELGVDVPNLIVPAATAEAAGASPDEAVRAAAGAARKGLELGKQPRALQGLSMAMGDLKFDNDSLRQQLADLTQQHAHLAEEHAAALATARDAVAELQAAHATNSDLVGRELERMGKSMKLVESCDLGSIASQVLRMSRHLDETDIVVKHIKDKEIPEVRTELHGVRLVAEEAAAGGEVRAAVLALERDVEVVKKRLSGSLAAALGVDAAALAGAARQSDVSSLSEIVEQKLGRSEAQALMRKTANVALEAARLELEAAAARAVTSAAARAIKSRCLSCDRDVAPVRPEPLGPLPSACGLLPMADKFGGAHGRPATAGAAPTGPGLNAAAARQMVEDERRGVGACGRAAVERRAGSAPRPGTARTPVFM
eukprot:jgi/Ulvmu1/9517/UM053_0005.1